MSIDAPGVDPPPLMEAGYRSPGELGQTMAYLYLEPEGGSGLWRFIARSRDQVAHMTVAVGDPVMPGYRHVDTRNRRYVDFVIVGLKPHQPYALHFYDPRLEALTAEYFSTLRGHVDQRGSDTVTIDSLGAERDCYIAKLEVAGHFVDDEHNTLSTFCPEYETD